MNEATSLPSTTGEARSVTCPVPNPDGMVTTVLVSRNSLLQAGLRHLLTNTDFSVTDIPVDESAQLPRWLAGIPVLFIVDTSHSFEQMSKIVRSLKAQLPQARVVVLAEHFECGHLKEEYSAGVDGFLLTNIRPSVLVKSLELIMLGESVFPSSMISAVLGASAARSEPAPLESSVGPAQISAFNASPCKLSSREAEILRFLVNGAPNKIIARKLDVAEATVKVHIKAILRKMGAANRTQAAVWAREHLPTAPAAPGDPLAHVTQGVAYKLSSGTTIPQS